MNGINFNNRLSTTCECGRAITVSDIASAPVKCTKHFYYGGRVTHFADMVCPKCGHKYILCLQAANNTYKLIDTIDNGKAEPQKAEPKKAAAKTKSVPASENAE